MTQVHKYLVVTSCLFLIGIGLLLLTGLSPLIQIVNNSTVEPVIRDSFTTLYLQSSLKLFGWAAIGLMSLKLDSKASNLWLLLAALTAIDGVLVLALYRYDGFILLLCSLCFLSAAIK